MSLSLNPHPPLSSFPIVLIVSLLLCECLGLSASKQSERAKLFQHAVEALLFLLLLFTPVTYFSGYWGVDFAKLYSSVPEDSISRHEVCARLFFFTSFFCGLCFFLRRAVPEEKVLARRITNACYYGWLLVSIVVALWTGYLGGQLVFVEGAGVYRLGTAE